MHFSTKTVWIVISLVFLATASLAQSKADCRKSPGVGDRFADSWSGAVTGIEIVENKLSDARKVNETKVTLKIASDGRLAEWYLSTSKLPVFGRHVYAYDNAGRVIQRSSFNPDGSPVLDDLYVYDASGNLLSQVTQNARSKMVVGSKKEFKYDTTDSYEEFSDGQFVRRVELIRGEGCRVVESKLLKKDSKLENRVTMAYDGRNKLIEQIVYSPAGRPIQKIKYEYEYDDRQNWIKKRSYEWHYWDSTEGYTLMSEEIRTLKYAGAE